MRGIDAARVCEDVHRALADVDIDREIQHAMEEVRRELKDEDIRKLVDEALKDIDIDAIVREATEEAARAARRHAVQPK